MSAAIIQRAVYVRPAPPPSLAPVVARYRAHNDRLAAALAVESPEALERRLERARRARGGR